jgi:formylglycine-generating enzyme required for sulfatase activity
MGSTILWNAWEWCSDWFAYRYYESSPTRDPSGPDNASSPSDVQGRTARSVRGGDWGSIAKLVRVSARIWFQPDYPHLDVGFRCVREVIP